MRRGILAVAIVMALVARARAACVGDCSGNGQVTVDELVRGVTIALGTGQLDQCPSFDSSGDGVVAINELIAAVGSALAGCVSSGDTPTPTITATPAGETPTPVAGCGDGTFAVTLSDIAASSNVTRAGFTAANGKAVDAGVGPYVWTIVGDPCDRPAGEVVRSFAINVSDAPTRLVPGTYAITIASPPFIRVDYRETKFVFGNPGQSFAHQWLSTAGRLEVTDAGGGALHVRARDVTMDIGATFPDAVGTFTLDISGTVRVTHN